MANDGPDPSISRTMLVVGAALLAEDGRLLLQQRPAGKQHAGLWEFPGGKVEGDEAPAGALARELAEELGIRVEEGSLMPVGFATTPTGGRELLLLLYATYTWVGDPRAMEAAAIGWFSLAEAARLPMPPADPPLLAMLARRQGVEARAGIEPACKDLQSSA